MIVEWIDFECPYCQNAHADIQELLTVHGENFACLIKHLPENPGHPQLGSSRASTKRYACKANRAALEFHNFALGELDDEVDNLRIEFFQSQDISEFEAHRQATVKLVTDWLDTQQAQSSEVDPELVMGNWNANDVHLRIRDDVQEAIALGATGLLSLDWRNHCERPAYVVRSQ